MAEPRRYELVAEYYRRIDAVDIDWVRGIFHRDAIYRRAETVYAGIAAIDRFFRHERRISGHHDVTRLLADDEHRMIASVGRFEGHGAAGDDRSVGFVDIWCFDGDAMVTERQTYLALGADYVRA